MDTQPSIRTLPEALEWGRRAQEAEEQVRAALDAAPLATVFMTPTGQPRFRNRAYAELLGYEADSFSELPFERLVMPEYESIAVGAMNTAQQGGDAAPVDLKLLHRDGTTVEVELLVARVEIDAELIGLIATFRDVTVERAALTKLQESRRQHRRAQELAGIGHWDWNIAAGRVRWSEGVYRIYGVTAESEARELPDTTFLQFVHPDDRALVRSVVERAIESGERYDCVHRIIRPDGGIRTVRRVGEVTRGADGSAVRILGTVLDITEMTASKVAEIEQREFLKTTLDAIRSGVIVTRGGVIAEASARAEELLGYPTSELIGMRFGEFFTEEDRAWLSERGDARRRGEPGPASTIVRARRKDGSWFDMDVRGTPHFNGGVVEGVVVDFRDVTAELELKRLADRRAEQIDAILEATPDAVIVADGAGLIVQVNAAAGATFGYEHGELEGQPLSVLVPGVYTASRSRSLREHEAQRQPVDGTAVERFVEATGHHRDGSVFPVEYAVAETTLEDGQRLFVAAIRDISAQRQSERELRRLNREIDSRARDRQLLVQQLLVAQEEERRTVSYDIHDGPAQQLAAAQMFLETYVHDHGLDLKASDTESLDRAKTYLEAGLGEIRRIMSGLRPSLLDDLGLIDALRALLEDLTRETAVTPILAAEPLPEDVPQEVEITIYRIVQEAAGNGIKYSGTDRVRVSLSLVGAAIELDVRDWGTGFDLAEVDGPHAGHQHGLVGMRERVELLGGDFELESAPGEGTAVKVVIPLAQERGSVH